jgi:hypothetical protein
MTTFSIYDGGSRLPSAGPNQYPSTVAPSAENPEYTYADHQRARLYAVTKAIDLRRTRTGNNGGVKQALLHYFQNNPAPVAGDLIEVGVLLPNTLLTGVSWGIVSPLPGFTFAIKVKNAATTVQATVSAATVPVNAAGSPAASYKALASGGLLITDTDFLVLEVLTAPATGLLAAPGTESLNMWVTAHVFDLNNGNT